MPERRFSVMEIFGPTIQGEGPDAGRPCLFVRLGGCDYRCSWCDSMYAVEPAQVRAKAEKLTAAEIVKHLAALKPPIASEVLVVLSGGNPALHDLGPLLELGAAEGLVFSVETQGSRWRPWLADVRQLVVSPKPPSSGMCTAMHVSQTTRFIEQLDESLCVRPMLAVAVKYVVQNETDYEWAITDLLRWPLECDFYLSVCTDQEPPATLDQVAERYRWLCERAAKDGDCHRRPVKVLPQLHVLAWGHARAV